jgi:N-acetylmuramoyl-L-alanine amidase
MNEKQLTNPLYFVYLAGALIALLVVYLWFSPTSDHGGVGRSDPGRLAVLPPKAVPTPPPSRRTVQGAGRPRIGIVAGHSGFDSGAVCPDGLTEVSINLNVAQAVVAQLEAEGLRVDLLEEYDDRLDEYTATALISVHADACLYPEATGFKVASLEGSTNPLNQVLVECLASEYKDRTGMQFHANSITYDMTQYHVFNTIRDQTPGAIIEVGFMLTDRELLTEQPDLVAQGIVDGIYCFLSALRESRTGWQ